MILFSSFNHIYVLLLFLYLGLCSGLIYFATCFLLGKAKLFLLKPKKADEQLKGKNNAELNQNNLQNENANKGEINAEKSIDEINENNFLEADATNQNNEIMPVNKTSNLNIDNVENSGVDNFQNETDNNKINNEFNASKEFLEPLKNIELETISNNSGFKDESKKQTKNLQESQNVVNLKTKNVFKQCVKVFKFCFFKKNDKVEKHTIHKSISTPKGKELKNNKEHKKSIGNKQQNKLKKNGIFNFKKLKAKWKNSVKVFFSKLNKAINKIKKPIIAVLETLIKIGLVLALVVVSYLINLHLNFGEVRLMFVVVFIASFCLAKSLLKLLAFYLTNFYNYFRRKLQKRR